ncbi:hypothetical protein J27TS7_34140 [Paenibacillus dendritiformis]|uniref:DUF4373 domain-containing protein n=1 Tax=Paenibacillus dendritiformis TaxID=130049 RepID=UPI001AFEFB01|nr:DUF4373 domain-containing protein [Paenibacillus dendritiformis]GIO73900.1 hypothetical protein J27TS7_34140 [Paenibacillus dendritiformis]
MARPTKEGLDYFPLDVDFYQDDKLTVPLGKFGMEGLGIIVRLMSEIYKNGYYYLWGVREQYAFSFGINVDINIVSGVVNECAEWGFFHKGLLESHQILTSAGFQKRYLEAAKRRKFITFIEGYLLIDPVVAQTQVNRPIKVVNSDGKEVNVYINPSKCESSDTETPQSKVKESKVIKNLTRQRYDEDDRYMKMARYFHDKIMEHAEANKVAHLVKEPNFQNWADEFRKIMELDKRDPKELHAVIDWCTADTFWSPNILSPKKLRAKYTELAMKMQVKTKPAVSRVGANKELLQRKMAEVQNDRRTNDKTPITDFYGLPDGGVDG